MNTKSKESRYWITEQGKLEGYGVGRLTVRRVHVSVARRVILTHHYSGTVVNNSWLHFGVFLDGEMLGAL